MTYPVSSTPDVFVDRSALAEMQRRLSQPGTRAVLVGYGEHAKHLINWFPENVVAVYDQDSLIHGIFFRGIPVISAQQKVDTNLIIACEYNIAYEFMGEIVKLYDSIPYFIPSTLNKKSTIEINVFEQEEIYRKLFSESYKAPLSMMVIDKMKFLLEMLQLGLTFEGDIVEMGSWQGGSTWYIAKFLALRGESRKIFAMDLFELHMMDFTATMCTDEIGRRLKAANPNVELVVGLCDDDASLSRLPEKLAFAHIDLGCLPKALNYIWDRLSVGAPIVLDNYGHLAATWPFDDFFKSKNTRVNRLPWSEQGIVFKR